MSESRKLNPILLNMTREEILDQREKSTRALHAMMRLLHTSSKREFILKHIQRQLTWLLDIDFILSLVEDNHGKLPQM